MAVGRSETIAYTALEQSGHFGNHVGATESAALTGKGLEHPGYQFALGDSDDIGRVDGNANVGPTASGLATIKSTLTPPYWEACEVRSYFLRYRQLKP